MRNLPVLGRDKTRRQQTGRNSRSHQANGLNWLMTFPLALAIFAVPASVVTAAAATTHLGPKSQRPSDLQLSGAGSTFDAPFFSAAFTRYHQLDPDVSVSY